MDAYIENTGFENYREHIYSAYHYYSLVKKLHNTYRIRLKLESLINGTILEHAVQNTMRRYPYLLLCRKNTFKETLLEYNPLPVVVKHTAEPIALGCEESNHHLLAFSYDKDILYINGFHGLLDGAGIYPVITTLLYYYCKEAYDPNLSAEGVRVIGDTIEKEEYTDPFPKKVPKEWKSLCPRPLFSRTFHIKNDKRVHANQKMCTSISISEKELMNFCRTNDGSPAVLISVVLCRAIAALNPNVKLPIVAGIALNLRPAFNAPKAHHSLTDILPLEFSKRLQTYSFDTQNTAFRSQILLKADPQTVCKNLAFASKTFSIMQKVPCLALKRLVYGLSVPSQFAANTFMLSYTGKANFGEAQKYIKGMHVDMDSPDIGISVEMSALHGEFFIDFMVDFPENLYLDAFCEELDNLGIPYARGETIPLKNPKCRY